MTDPLIEHEPKHERGAPHAGGGASPLASRDALPVTRAGTPDTSVRQAE